MIPAFPLVLMADLDGNEYHGFVTFNDVDYRIRVCKPRISSSLDFEVEPDLRTLLRSEEDKIRQRLARSSTIPGFLSELKEILDRLSTSIDNCSAPSAPPAEAMQQIVEEIESVGWENVKSLQDGFRMVTLIVEDEVKNHSVAQPLQPLLLLAVT